MDRDADLAVVWDTKAAVTDKEGDSPTAMMLAEHIADLLAAEGGKP